ncbi:hypothetical protein Tco_1175273 [Tanacetum coccineum]
MIALCGKDFRMCDFLSNIDFSLAAHSYSLLVDPDIIGHGFYNFGLTGYYPKVINDVPHIRAKVAGKKILISEATIRADLLFDDENGIDCFPKQVIWETAESSDDDFWKDQEEWEIIRWRFHESSGVHHLEIEDGTMIHMLVKKISSFKRVDDKDARSMHEVDRWRLRRHHFDNLFFFILVQLKMVENSLNNCSSNPFMLLRRHVAEKNNLFDAKTKIFERNVLFQDTQTDCVQDTAQRMKLKKIEGKYCLNDKTD